MHGGGTVDLDMQRHLMKKRPEQQQRDMLTIQGGDSGPPPAYAKQAIYRLVDARGASRRMKTLSIFGGSAPPSSIADQTHCKP